MYWIKRLYYKFLEYLEPLLDAISTRTCYLCANGFGEIICNECLEEKLSLKKKSIDYKILDYFFASYEQVHHPKIFFLINFYKETSYLIKKSKYSRPHYAKTLAKALTSTIQNNLQSILNDDLDLNFLNNHPESTKPINLYLSYTPMHHNKERTRSFNFAQILAKKSSLLLKQELNSTTKLLFQSKEGLKNHPFGSVVFLDSLFIRKKDTKALYNLGQESRIKEIKNAFELNSFIDISQSQDDSLNILLIIDDICTTGSTLLELMQVARSSRYFDELICFTLYGRNLI